jgi:tetratricopeptide (TPR) repeat protein
MIADDSEGPDILSDEGYESFFSRWSVIADSPEGMALRARALELFMEQTRSLGNDYSWLDLETLVERMRPLFLPPKLELESLAQVLKALNRREKITIDRGELKGEDHWQEGLVSLLTGDWKSAEKSLQAAAPALPKEVNVVLAHAYLGRSNPRLALQAAERALESATSIERYLKDVPGKTSEIERYRETNAGYRNLVADCLFASGRPIEALDLKIEALPREPKDHKLHALRIEDIYRTGRGRWPFLTTVKWRIKALSAGWKAEEKESPYYCPQRYRKRLEEHWAKLEAYLEHRPQRLDVETLIEPRFSSFERTRHYLDRVAGELRLRGEPRAADRLVARQALMQRARSLCDRIVFGAKEG